MVGPESGRKCETILGFGRGEGLREGEREEEGEADRNEWSKLPPQHPSTNWDHAGGGGSRCQTRRTQLSYRTPNIIIFCVMR